MVIDLDDERFNCCYIVSETKVFIGTNLGRVYEGELQKIDDILKTEFKNEKLVVVFKKNLNEVFKFSQNSTIRSIQPLDSDSLIISSDLGGIVILDFNSKKISLIQDDIGGKNNKIWRLLVIDERNFITIGNYRQIKHWKKLDTNQYYPITISENGSALFCLDWYDFNKKIFLTNDFSGLIDLWNFQNGNIINISSFNGDNNLQKVLSIDNKYIISIDWYGTIYIYKKENNFFEKIEEFTISFSTGNWIQESIEKDSILIGTDDNLILLNRDFNEIKVLNIEVKQIINVKNTDLILTSKTIVRPNYKKAYIPLELLKYKFIKVGLVGDSQVGKTCFCKYLETEKFQDTQSSFGRHIWRIPYKDEGKRMLLFDLAGQKSELFTYFPMIQDSDIILLFYQVIKRDSFDQAIEYYKELRDKCTKSKFFFVQTFTDQIPRVKDFYIANEFKKNNLDVNAQLIKISSTQGTGFNEFYSKIIDQFDWNKAPAIIKLRIYDRVEEKIHELYNNGIESISLEELQSEIKQIDLKRLERIILSLNNQGYFEYIESEKEIIINDEEYTQIYSEIAEYVTQKYGFVKSKELISELGTDSKSIKYIKNILQYYKDYSIATFFREDDVNNEVIVFTRKLDQEISIPEEYEDKLPDEFINFYYQNKDINIDTILHFLSQYPLDLITISKNEILFKLEHNSHPTFMIIKFTSANIEKKEKIISIAINKRKEIDFLIEKELLNYLLGMIGEKLSNVNIEDKLKEQIQIQDVDEQLKNILKIPIERTYIDFKKQLYLTNNFEKAEFVKDFLSLANSSHCNNNQAFLIIGIEEKQNEIKSVNNVGNIDILEEQISQLLNKYLNLEPIFEYIPKNILELYNWQSDNKISKDIPFSNDQKNHKSNEKIIVLKIIRNPGSVYEISKDIYFKDSKGVSKCYEKGDSWIRISSHSFKLEEKHREILRNG